MSRVSTGGPNLPEPEESVRRARCVRQHLPGHREGVQGRAPPAGVGLHPPGHPVERHCIVPEVRVHRLEGPPMRWALRVPGSVAEWGRPAQRVGWVHPGLPEGPAEQARKPAPRAEPGQGVHLLAAACAAGRTFLLWPVEAPLRIVSPREGVRARGFVVFAAPRDPAVVAEWGPGQRIAPRLPRGRRREAGLPATAVEDRAARGRIDPPPGVRCDVPHVRILHRAEAPARWPAAIIEVVFPALAAMAAGSGTLPAGPRRPAVIMGHREALDVAHAEDPVAADSENQPHDSSESPGIQS